MSAQRPISSRAYRRAASRLHSAAQANDLPCAICQLPIDWTAVPRTRWAFSADHIVERDTGGHLTDPANLQATHYGCNARRGAEYGNRKRTTPTVWPVKTSRDW